MGASKDGSETQSQAKQRTSRVSEEKKTRPQRPAEEGGGGGTTSRPAVMRAIRNRRITVRIMRSGKITAGLGSIDVVRAAKISEATVRKAGTHHIVAALWPPMRWFAIAHCGKYCILYMHIHMNA